MSKVNYIRCFLAEYECILLICNSRNFQILRQISKVFTFVNTRAHLESWDVFLNLMKSNPTRNRRKFQVSMADYPHLKPNTISYVLNSYLLKYAFFLARFQNVFYSLCEILCFKSSFKKYEHFISGFYRCSLFCLQIQTALHHSRIISVCVSVNWRYMYRPCYSSKPDIDRFHGNLKCKSKHYHTEDLLIFPYD